MTKSITSFKIEQFKNVAIKRNQVNIDEMTSFILKGGFHHIMDARSISSHTLRESSYRELLFLMDTNWINKLRYTNIRHEIVKVKTWNVIHVYKLYLLYAYGLINVEKYNTFVLMFNSSLKEDNELVYALVDKYYR